MSYEVKYEICPKIQQIAKGFKYRTAIDEASASSYKTEKRIVDGKVRHIVIPKIQTP